MKRLLRIAALATILLLVSCAQQIPNPEPVVTTPVAPKETEEPRDFSGRPLDLKESEGRILLIQNYYLVIDGSGSMGSDSCSGKSKDRMEAAKAATTAFVSKSIPAEANVGLFAFDRSGIGERVPLGSDNRSEVLAAITQLRSDGGTPLNAAIGAAVDALRIQRAKQLGYGSHTAIIITDGEATDGGGILGASTKRGVEYALQHEIPLLTIGFCLDKDHDLARGSIAYRNAINPDELLAALEDVVAEAETY